MISLLEFFVAATRHHVEVARLSQDARALKEKAPLPIEVPVNFLMLGRLMESMVEAIRHLADMAVKQVTNGMLVRQNSYLAKYCLCDRVRFLAKPRDCSREKRKAQSGRSKVLSSRRSSTVSQLLLQLASLWLRLTPLRAAVEVPTGNRLAEGRLPVDASPRARLGNASLRAASPRTVPLTLRRRHSGPIPTSLGPNLVKSYLRNHIPKAVQKISHLPQQTQRSANIPMLWMLFFKESPCPSRTDHHSFQNRSSLSGQTRDMWRFSSKSRKCCARMQWSELLSPPMAITATCFWSQQRTERCIPS